MDDWLLYYYHEIMQFRDFSFRRYNVSEKVAKMSKKHVVVDTDSTGWDKQACTHDTLWHQRYVTTSTEYLISSHNSHFLSKYFE